MLVIGGTGFIGAPVVRALLLDERMAAWRGTRGYVENVAEVVDEATALGRTIDWERAHPPAEVDPAAFDYAAEDRALAAA